MDRIAVVGFSSFIIKKGLKELIEETDDPLIYIPVSSKNTLAEQTLQLCRELKTPFNVVVEVVDETTEDYIQGALETIIAKDPIIVAIGYASTVAVGWDDSDDVQKVYKFTKDNELEIVDISEGLMSMDENDDEDDEDDDDGEVPMDSRMQLALHDFAVEFAEYLSQLVVSQIRSELDKDEKPKVRRIKYDPS
jgi:hypothetical protein